jgi:excinuclease UvrABC nuclease subunit
LAYVYNFKDINGNIIYVGKTAQTLDKGLCNILQKDTYQKNVIKAKLE